MEDRFTKALCVNQTPMTIKTIKLLWKMKKKEIQVLQI